MVKVKQSLKTKQSDYDVHDSGVSVCLLKIVSAIENSCDVSRGFIGTLFIRFKLRKLTDKIKQLKKETPSWYRSRDFDIYIVSVEIRKDSSLFTFLWNVDINFIEDLRSYAISLLKGLV